MNVVMVALDSPIKTPPRPIAPLTHERMRLEIGGPFAMPCIGRSRLHPRKDASDWPTVALRSAAEDSGHLADIAGYWRRKPIDRGRSALASLPECEALWGFLLTGDFGLAAYGMGQSGPKARSIPAWGNVPCRRIKIASEG
jgi:hypothetical protein